MEKQAFTANSGVGKATVGVRGNQAHPGDRKVASTSGPGMQENKESVTKKNEDDGRDNPGCYKDADKANGNPGRGVKTPIPKGGQFGIIVQENPQPGGKLGN